MAVPSLGTTTWRAVLLVLGLVGGLLGTAGPVHAAAGQSAVYVDRTSPSCSDSGPGTAVQPFCTIVKGVSHLAAGWTLYIGDGTYPETIKPAVSGSPTAPITITAWPGRDPVVGSGMSDGVAITSRAYLTVSDLVIANTVNAGIAVSSSNHVTVSGNEVRNAGFPRRGETAVGISIKSTTDSQVSNNFTHNNSDSGIYLSSGSTRVTVSFNESTANAQGWQRNANGINVISPGNILLGNRTYDNEDSGIQFYPGGNDNLAALNVTYGNGDHGIDDLNVTGGRLIGNTVYRNCTSGINVEGTSGNYVVENNIAVDNAVYPAYGGLSCSRRAGNIGIWDSAPPTTVVDHNLVWLSRSGTMYVFKSSFSSLAAMRSATGQEASGVQGDPKFQDAAAGELQLTAGSPAIDRADSAVAEEQSTDVLGLPRVDDPATPNSFASGPRLYDDVGAYEFQPSQAPPTQQPPTATLTLTPTTGTTPVQVTADATGSTDPQGQALTYTFDFGDGTTLGPQTTATAKHTYTTPGTYTAQVTVTDTSGLTATKQATVTTTQAPPTQQPPTATLTLTPTTGTTPVQVTADATGSTDPQGQALTYTFDFGDGTTLGPQTTATAKHTYTTPGTYTAQVTVTDTSGLTATKQATVTTTQAPPTQQPPTATLTLTPTTGTTPVQVTADATGSTDPQGQALTYTFDFGDGTTLGPQTTATAKHTYTTPGTYTAQVTVTDTSGLTATKQATVTTTQAPPTQQPPTATLTLTPTTGTTPVQVTADATGSTDPQGQALTYTFDFGDGTTLGPQTTATAKHTYTTPGTYTAQVTVTDTSGLTATKQATVTTTQAPPTQQPPTATLTLTPTTGTTPVQVTADATGSTDPQGQTLTYTFDFGDGTTLGPQTTATAKHTYTTPGTYTAQVTVTDTSGLTATKQATVTTTQAPPTQQNPPGYVSSIATNYSTNTKTSAYVTVWRSGGVQAGDLVVLTVQLQGTAASGDVSATDTKGNTYTMASSVSDASGNRLVVLAGVASTALVVNDKITASFPSSAGYRITSDEFSGVTSLDRTAGANGSGSAFSSGATALTSTGNEVVFAAVSVPQATGSPSWTSGWRDLGHYAVGAHVLGRSYQLPTTPGTFAASGSAPGSWLATVVTFKP